MASAETEPQVFDATIESMSLFEAWQNQYIESDWASSRAVRQWCSVCPGAHEWSLWLDSMAGAHDHWGHHVLEALGQDNRQWEQFLRGASGSRNYKDNATRILDYIRVSSIDMGRSLTPLPLVCVEALAATISHATPRWKQQLLAREPAYWFGSGQGADPALIAPLHELAAQLFCGSQFPIKRLPALAWSPSMLYDDYGLAPATVEHLQAPIQHALEYAVYMHQTKGEHDSLARAELHHYFSESGLDIVTFETLLDLSQEAPTLDNCVRVIQAMFAPTAEQYHVDFNDETPQP